jgi:hypothetical protein
LEAVFILLEFSSPSRRIFIGSHSLPPSLVRRIGPSTDAITMEVVEMVLVGKVNKQLVSLISLARATATGLCGKDTRLLTARQSRDAPSLGFVGEVTRVDPSVLQPIIASEGKGGGGASERTRSASSPESRHGGAGRNCSSPNLADRALQAAECMPLLRGRIRPQ